MLVRKNDNVPAWLSVSMCVGTIQRLLYGYNECAGLLGRERKGCVGSGCLGVGQSPQNRVFRVVRYVFLGSQRKSDGVAMYDSLNLEAVA
jgi:hypothetical protein